MEGKKHKWAEVIKAWADGAAIEWRLPENSQRGWTDWQEAAEFPCFTQPNTIEWRIKPTPPPLRVEDVPLGFPCRLKSGHSFVPLHVKAGGLILGWHAYQASHWYTKAEEIDPTSIIPTREVWLVLREGSGHFIECFSEPTTNLGVTEFVYGPIRIPLRPLPN